jgi:hypothetical protein
VTVSSVMAALHSQSPSGLTAGMAAVKVTRGPGSPGCPGNPSVFLDTFESEWERRRRARRSPTALRGQGPSTAFSQVRVGQGPLRCGDLGTHRAQSGSRPTDLGVQLLPRGQTFLDPGPPRLERGHRPSDGILNPCALWKRSSATEGLGRSRISSFLHGRTARSPSEGFSGADRIVAECKWLVNGCVSNPWLRWPTAI